MSSQVGSGHVAIFPVLTGFKSTVSKEIKSTAADGAKSFGSGFRGVGTTVGKRLGSDVKTAMAAAAGDLGAQQLKNLNRDVASASAALSRARLKQQDEAGRVRVAEARLQEAIAKSGEGSARAVAAEERLAAARRQQQAAADAVTAASARLASAHAAVAAATATAATTAAGGSSRLLGLARSFRAGFTDAHAARSAFTGVAGSIGGLLRSVSDVSGLTKLGGLARAAAQQASTAFTSLATMIGGKLAGAGRSALGVLSGIGSTVGRALAPVGRSIASVATTVASPFVQLGSKVSTWLSPVTTQVSGLFAKLGAAAGPAVSRIGSSFSTGLSGLASSATSALSSLVGAVGGAASRVGAALGNGIKSGATAGVAAVAAGIGIAFTKGVGRLQAIDVAQAKLRGLGNDAGTVTAIMGDALSSVKGTAFGLGEAATVAAGAVAAGIKPGEQLRGTLKGIANVAAATNGTMEETGAVFNKVAATGRAYAENINQLADRGLPIWGALAKQLGVTTDEVRDLAAKGEIDFATFSAAASAAAGTVALEMGNTVPGAARNFFAAMGRIGANALGGLYSKVAPLIQAATSALGPIEERAKQFGDILTRVVGPAMDWVTGLLNKIGSGASLAGTGLGGLTGLIGPLAAGLGALGIGGLGGLLTRIPLLSSLLPGLSGALGLLGGPLGIAGAALAGFLASGGDAGALVTSVTGVIDQVVGMLPTLIQAIVGAVPGIVQGILAAIPQLLNAAVGIVGALVDGIVTAVPLLVDGAVTLVTGLVSAIIANLPAIIDGAIALVGALLQGIITALPVIVQGAITLVTSLLSAIVGALPTIIEGGIQLLLALVEGIIEALPTLIEAAIDLVMQLLQAIIDNLPMIIDAGIQLLLSLVDGLIEALPDLITAAITLVLQLVAGLITMLPKLIEAGIQLVISLITGLIEAIPKIVKMLPQIVEAIWNGLANVDWLDLGTQIVQGIIDGLASMGKALLDAIVDLAASAFEGFKDFFGIASPARRMKQPGRDVVRGAVVGVEDEAPAFGDALVSMADSASAKAQAAMSRVSTDVSTASRSTGASVTPSSSSTAQDRLRPIQLDGIGTVAWLREFVDGRAEIVLDESVRNARTASRGR